MKLNNSRNPYLSPFMLWNTLAMKSAEMMLASAQVIGHRVGRMALAGPAPHAHDRREFALMGQEKIEASMQSALAMATQMMTMNQRLGAQIFKNLLRSSVAFVGLAGSRTPAQLISRQSEFARALGQSAVGIAGVSNGAAKLAHRGLKPIHAKATANAKRLARR